MNGHQPSAPRIAFAFTGQGAQYPGMTTRLYIGHDRYRAHLDAAAAALRPYTGISMVDLIVGGDIRVHQTGFTQPAVFAVDYALAATLAEAGIRPVAVVGHSIGELAAAVVSQALDLESAALLAAVRGAYTQYLPSGGGMLAVSAPPEALTELVAREPTVGYGAYNGPRATVLSGDLYALDRIQLELARRGIASGPLHVSHAFHSPLMRPMVQRYARVAAMARSAPPRLPFYSTVRGRRLLEEALDALYWVEHVTAPVRFHQAVERLLAEQAPDLVVEIGPKPLLANLVRAIAGPGGPPCVCACDGEHTDAAAFDRAAANWVPGGADAVTRSVLAAIARVVDDPGAFIGPDVALHGDLGFDSVMLMQLKFQLEQRLPALGKLSLPDMLDSALTPAALSEYLRAQLVTAGAA